MGEVARDPYYREEPYIKVPANYRLSSVSVDNALESINPAREYVEEKAAIFWGIKDVAFFSPIVAHLPERLGYMRRALGRISSIKKPEYQEEQDWIALRKRKRISNLQSATNRRLRIPKKILETTSRTTVPLSYGDAFNDPDIQRNLLGQLLSAGDPKITVIQAFDDWRIQYIIGKTQLEKGVVKKAPDLDSKKILQGFEAFKLFLFGAGGKNFLSALKVVTIEYLQDNPGEKIPLLVGQKIT